MFEVTSRLNHACSPSVEWVAYADIPSLDSVRLMVLQCVAVCVAVCCREWVAYTEIPSLDSVRLIVLQCVAACVAVCRSVLQCVAESG